MTHLVRRFRGLGVALVVLAFSAGAVFAAAPRLASSAAAPAGAHVPTTIDSQADEAPDKTETVDNETEDTTQPGDATEPTEPTDAQDGHGLMVSTAAQMATPTGFANHGAFVSCVARMDQGVSMTAGDFANLTPASCPAKPNADANANAQGSKATGTTHGNAGKSKSSTKSHGHSQAAGQPVVTLPIVATGRP